MSTAYLIAAGTAAKLASIRPQLIAVTQSRNWHCVYDTPVGAMFCSPGAAISRMESHRGVVIGGAYERHGSSRAVFPSLLPASLAISSGIRMRTLWGNFIAMTLDPVRNAVTVQRPPFGQLGAYYFVTDSIVLISSEPAPLRQIEPTSGSISWEGLIRQLVWDDLCDRRTCLEVIQDLRAGESLEIDGEGRLHVRWDWNPWCWQRSDQEITDFESAKELVRREIDHCIGVHANGDSRDIIDLSGGFDSSLIASRLHAFGQKLCAFTIFSDGADGDERRYARLVAERCGISLIERSPEAARVDVTRSAARNLPRPYTRSFVQEVDRLRSEAARQTGATRFFNGGGGDNVFCHLQSSAPAADALLAFGPGRKFMRTVFNVAASAEASFWDVAWKSARKAGRAGSGRAWRTDHSLLRRESYDHLSFTDDPPWPSLPAGVRPGHVEHVQNLAVASFNAKGFERSDQLSCTLPLFAQPLAEACLRVPSWVWITGARNRAVARAASSAHLPAEVADRRSKGGLGDFQRAIFEVHQKQIREMLMDGELAAHSIIDAQAVDAEFAGSGVFNARSCARLLRLCDVEAWLACWR